MNEKLSKLIPANTIKEADIHLSNEFQSNLLPVCNGCAFRILKALQTKAGSARHLKPSDHHTHKIVYIFPRFTQFWIQSPPLEFETTHNFLVLLPNSI